MGILSELKRIKAGVGLLYHQYISPLKHSGYGKIGEKSIIKNNSILNKKNVYVDDWVIIQDQTNFISNNGKLIVGKYSVISSGCTIIPGAHKLTVGVPFYLTTTNHLNDDEGDIVIEEDCWIGAGCILLPNCHIGRGAVVGAGSIVKKNIPPYAVVIGAPAHIVAAKFSIEQIIRHEAILYPPQKRLSKEILIRLFEDNYKGLRTIGTDNLDGINLYKLEEIRKKYEMKNHTFD